MPADEVTHGTDVDESRARTGPRHAAPKKPLFTRFHMPAGKAIAMAAMPTAVLMGMGFTSTLAQADNNSTTPTAKSLTADEYKDCVAALDADKDGSSASPTPSASASDDTKGDTKDGTKEGTKDDDKGGKDGSPEPAPSASSSADSSGSSGSDGSSGTSGSSGSSGKTSSSDSGADDKASEPSGGDTAAPQPSATSGGGLLDNVGKAIDGIGDTVGSVLTGGKPASGGDSASGTDATPSPSASPTASAAKDGSGGGSSGTGASGTVKDTTGKVTDTVKNTVKDVTGTASKAAEDTKKTVKDTVDAATATASPSPSASSTTDPENCPAATDAEGGVDNKVPLADDPWYLDASSLTLKGADYKGIVKVRTANGTVKKVLKYVISGGTEIGDLHQTVKDKQAGKTYHVQAAKGSKSTITGGDTVMYTESISGNLLGLIPITFDPDNPPPLNIPLIYFTKVHVVQAAQFGGNLHVPGMHVFTTD
ncbi:hypothetical protein [Streptomyces sp. NPDC004065]|uniref:hypothetical protein n=1 Tax=Streptomyces sp. NPDC004065 TaxID=3364689 RepID=UPI00384FA641